MPVHVNRDLQRAHRAARRGLEALRRRVPAFTEARWDSDDPRDSLKAKDERTQRARLEALDAGRELIAAALDLERQAETAKRAGVEALRHAWPALSWADIGELLGVSGQAAHKRYRDVEDAEAELTIDDELARHVVGPEVDIGNGYLARDEYHRHTPEQIEELAELMRKRDGAGGALDAPGLGSRSAP